MGPILAALLLAACSASPWSQAELSDPPDEPALSNGMVLSLGSGSFATASTLLKLSAAEEWPETIKLLKAPDGEQLEVQSPVPGWEQAKVSIHGTSLVASAVGLELIVDLGLLPMSVYAPDDHAKTCPAHVAFDHGTWTVPVRLTRSKLGSVQATAETPGELVADLIVSESVPCPELPDTGDASAMDPQGLFTDLSQLLVETFTPWLTDAIPASLGLDLAVTSSVTGDPLAGQGSVLIDIRTSLEDEVTWWHWSDEQLIVGFDTRVSSSLSACVPDAARASIPGAPIPSTTEERVWLLHTGTINATLHGLWRNGDLCLDRPLVANWSVSSWTDRWPELSALDTGSGLEVRLWPSQAPHAQFTSSSEGVEVSLSGQSWTLELYGRFQGAAVRLSTLELDVSLTALLEVSPERAIWLSDGKVGIERLELEDGLLPSPTPDTVQDLVESWVGALTTSAPMGWLPPTPQPAEVSGSVVGSYLLFSATH